MADRISRAFAEDGDKNSVPTDSAGTSMSFQDGWTSYYELEVGVDAGALDIDRGQHNQIWNMITANIKEWQEQTWPEYQLDIAYPKWSVVQYSDGNNYIVTTATTAGTLPTNTSYFENLDDFLGFGTAAYADLVTSISDATLGRSVTVGYLGIGQRYLSNDTDLGGGDYIIPGMSAVTPFASTLTDDPGEDEGSSRYIVECYGGSGGVAQKATLRTNSGRYFYRSAAGPDDLSGVPWNEVLSSSFYGTAAYVDTGTSSSQVPLNSDLGSVAYFERSTSTAINDGTSNSSVPTPLGLRNATIVSDSVKSGLMSVSSITPTVDATQTNNTDYIQYIYVQFIGGTGDSSAIQISDDSGLSWHDVGSRSGSAQFTQSITVLPAQSWRVRLNYLNITEISA